MARAARPSLTLESSRPFDGRALWLGAYLACGGTISDDLIRKA